MILHASIWGNSTMFNEENTVEQIILDTLCGQTPSNVLAEQRTYPIHQWGPNEI